MGDQADIADLRQNGVAVVALSTPPNGVLTADAQARLLEAVLAASQNPGCSAIVITGSGSNFALGTALSSKQADEDDSDADEFTQFGDICDQIEAIDKPVVAAINGPALGNGLELALAAHARGASPSAKRGAPEITIGLLPGAGGTQRLPKVIGGLAALKLLLSGRSVSGPSAKKLGLVDELVDTDVVEAAVDHALLLARSGEALKRSSTRRDRLGEGNAFLEAVSEHRRLAEKSALDAPLRLIECVEAALLLPYEVGRGLELSAFEDLLASDHSKALRHVFNAERALNAATVRTVREPSRPLKTIGVLGARPLGIEIAVTCLDAGFTVTLAEDKETALETAVSRIIEHYDALVAAGKLTDENVEDTLDRLQAVPTLEPLADADVVVDPGPLISRSMVSDLDSVMKAGAVLATGTESVDVARLASATKRPGDVVGLKFYSGMRKNRVAEIIPCGTTAPNALSTVRALARKLDRLTIEVSAGSEAGIGVRIMDALHAAADLCVLEGARIRQVDDVLQDWGLPMGSFALRDAQGLVRSRRTAETDDLTGKLSVTGRAGRLNGRGFYAYRKPGDQGVEDPDVAALIDVERAAKGITPKIWTDSDVRKLCLSAMAGAGAQVLNEGLVDSASFIDMVAVHGLGFARRTGGVMFAADLLGLEQVRKIILEASQRSPLISPPSPIFQDLINAEENFGTIDV